MRTPTLGGTLMIHNGDKLDYCWREAVECLKALCDQVVICEVGSDDNTDSAVRPFADYKTKVINLSREEWDSQHGKEKLNYFTNKAIEQLDTDWNLNLQGVEIIHEKSFSKF